MTDLQPTEEMATEATRGLEWRREYGRGGTEVGVARARDISNLTNLSPEDHIDERINYLVMQKVKVAAANETLPDGIQIDAREMAMLTPNELPTTNENQPTS